MKWGVAMMTMKKDVRDYYYGVYAEYLLLISTPGFPFSYELLSVLPGANQLNHINIISDYSMQLLVGTQVVQLDLNEDYPDVVYLTIDGEQLIAWDTAEIEEFLRQHALCPTDEHMVTVMYIQNWGRHIEQSVSTTEPTINYLATIVGARCNYYTA